MKRTKEKADTLLGRTTEIPGDMYNRAHGELCRMQMNLPAPGSEVNALSWIQKAIQSETAVPQDLKTLYTIVRKFPASMISRSMDGMILLKVDFRSRRDDA